MTSIKLKFRAHTDSTKEGALYFQVIHDHVVKQVKTDYRIYSHEWDKQRGDIVKAFPLSAARNEALKVIRDKVAWEQRKLEQIVKALENSDGVYTANDIIRRDKGSASDKTTVFEYMRRQSDRMKMLGKVRTSETYQQTLRSFMKFRNEIDLYFDMLDADMVEQYESYMRANNLSRNTTSFYMRILRCIYNRAVENGLVQQTNPFRRVYTGVDKNHENPTQYLLPIITKQDGTERQQYLNKILFVNRKLKQIAKLAKISTPLTMYVSRHSWASIAKSKNVPLSVISEGIVITE